MEWLTQRFNAIQDNLLNLIEQGAEDLDSQIKYWNLVRQENVYLYYGRREGLTHFGLQPLPVTTVSEYKAKEAINMVLLLQSLKKSAYARETWTLQNASAELINTQPRNCFKKQPYNVEVWFNNDRNNSYIYINWDFIYYQDSNDVWHKVPGLVYYYGMYYSEVGCEQVYFALFDTDDQRFGGTGNWSVHFKNKTLIAPTSSSNSYSSHSGKNSSSTVSSSTENTVSTSESPRRIQRPEVGSSTEETSTLRRRRRERESTPEGRATTPAKRRRGGGGGGGIERAAPSPEAVGSRHRSVPTSHLSRLARLQEEARDPPVIIVTGPPNVLKCWRYRKRNQNEFPVLDISTIFTWVGRNNTNSNKGRMLVAFEDSKQREQFVKHVTFPKHTSFAYGTLDKL